jgi:hypothetical protein
MSTLPETTLAHLRHLATAGQYDAKAILHLIARADRHDQDDALFVNSYSHTIAALCRRLEALERGAKDLPAPAAPVNDSPVANALLVAESALADVAEGEIGRLCSATKKVTWAELRCTEALAAIRPAMRQHGIRTSELAPASTPPPTAPADGLVERVANAMGPSTQAAMDAGELPFGNACTAIREIAAWLDTRGQLGCSVLLREEIDR